MIDASCGFTKDRTKNRRRERNIHKITNAYTREVEIVRNDFNLNIPRYIAAPSRRIFRTSRRT